MVNRGRFKKGDKPKGPRPSDIALRCRSFEGTQGARFFRFVPVWQYGPWHIIHDRKDASFCGICVAGHIGTQLVITVPMDDGKLCQSCIALKRKMEGEK